ncbi:MAG: rod shape-determining protein MreD [Pseudomonadota bacterium]|nr:rod shape-determining protein MreD [Pseudomonadota bacterium]
MIAILWLLMMLLTTLLAIMVLPVWVDWLAPNWAMLFVIFFAYFAPSRLQLIGVLVFSILLDSCFQLPLGTFGLALFPVAFLISKFNRTARELNALAQVLFILLTCLWHQVVFDILLTQGGTSILNPNNFGLLKLFTTGMVWLIYRGLSRLIYGKRYHY